MTETVCRLISVGFACRGSCSDLIVVAVLNECAKALWDIVDEETEVPDEMLDKIPTNYADACTRFDAAVIAAIESSRRRNSD